MRTPRLSRILATLAACVVAACVVAAAPSAQTGGDTVDLVLRGVPAGEALAAIAEATGQDVVYSTALVGDARVWCGGAGWTADDLLRCVTDAVGLDWVRRSSGTVVVTERVVEDRPGGVAGRVVDAETGEPLALAHVRLGAATVVTDGAGQFAIGDLAPGPHVVLASFVGYRARAARLTVAPGGVVTQTLTLAPAVARGETVVVDGFAPRLGSAALGADTGFEVLPERVAGAAGDRPGGDALGGDRPGRASLAEAGAPALADGAPAVTSSVDGAALQPLLGVAGRTFRDGLSLQGGEPGEHALLLDGARVYEPLAVGPALGAMSPLAVGRVTVRKAGFGAAAGSHLAGAVEAEHLLARPRRGLAVAAEGDLYAGSARVQHAARIGAAEATTLVAARRSAWDVVRPGALDRSLREWNAVDPVLAAALDAPTTAARTGYDAHRHGSDVAFSDLHAATRLRWGALRTARASLYRGTSDIATELFAVGTPHSDAPDPAAALLARDATAWDNTAATLRADAIVSARWKVGGGLRVSDHSLRQGYDALDGAAAGLTGAEATADAEVRLGSALDALPAATNGNDLTEVSLDLDADWALAAGHDVELGLEAALVRNRFHLLSAGVGETAFRDLDADHGQARVAAFAASRHRLGERWTLEPGLRLTTLVASGETFPEPRLALRFDALPTDRVAGVPLAGVAARLAAGVYRQFASRVELATLGPSALVPSVALWLPTDGTVAPPSALHVAGEVLWQPSAAWAARVEGYAKALPRVYALDYAALLSDGVPLADQADFLLPEQGRAVGVGARVERQAPRWAASAGLAWARTERRSDARFDGRWVPAPWAEPLRATLGLDVLVAGRRGGPGLLARARGLGIWGRSWALRRAYYDILPVRGHSAAGTVAFDRPEDDRLGPLLTLDLGLAATLAPGGVRTEIALDVANALDRRNVLDWSLRPAAAPAPAEAGGTVEAFTRTLPGIQPSLRIRVAF